MDPRSGASPLELECMSQENLASYLADHLAGSVAGVDLASHLIEAASHPQSRTFLEELKKDIEADQKQLEEIMARARLSRVVSEKRLMDCGKGELVEVSRCRRQRR
jgi:hypothetical protein